jgi:hypothetical protein
MIPPIEPGWKPLEIGCGSHRATARSAFFVAVSVSNGHMPPIDIYERLQNPHPRTAGFFVRVKKKTMSTKIDFIVYVKGKLNHAFAALTTANVCEAREGRISER